MWFPNIETILQLTPQLAISCLLQSRFWYASSCLSTSFLNAFATDPPTCNKLPLAKSLLVCQFLFPVLLCWTQWSFQLFCASWTKVLFGTLLTEHPFSISHAFRTMCSLSLNILISCFTLLDPMVIPAFLCFLD